MEAYKTKFPDSLRNAHDLQLGAVFLRYLGHENLPSLITIYELEQPSILAFNEINKMIVELDNNEVSEYTIKGIFALGISRFETMLSDLMKKILQFYPQKISAIKSKEAKGISVSQEVVNKGSLIESIIESEINKLAYADVETLLNNFCNILSIELPSAMEKIDTIVEIKETRNLLLHNNLVVNEFYLQKTKSVKRGNQNGGRLLIDIDYAVQSLQLLSSIIENVIIEVRKKYGKFTLLMLLNNLWRYTFKNTIIRIEDFCTLNEEQDIIDGPFTIPGFLSSSEKTYMEFWKSQRNGSSITNLSMVHLGSGRKLAFLVDVFGELRLTHW